VNVEGGVEGAPSGEGSVDVPKSCPGVKRSCINGGADVPKPCPGVEDPGITAASLSRFLFCFFGKDTRLFSCCNSFRSIMISFCNNAHAVAEVAEAAWHFKGYTLISN
jgi:hypothetical protein